MASSSQPPDDRRPPKRVSQACEACRRKKSRCPGEKPACSLCTRLNQVCTYADDGSIPELRSLAIERRMNARFAELENKLETLFKAIPNTPPTLPRTPFAHHAESSRPSPSRLPSSRQSVSVPDDHAPQLPSEPSRLDIAVPILLRRWNCQPLPLFHPKLEKDYESRGQELQFAILAMAGHLNAAGQNVDNWCDSNAQRARELAMGRILEGSVRLSTIQTLVLLSFLDFTNDNGQRSHLMLANAISLSQTCGLIDPQVVVTDPIEYEERRRCFWSIAMLENMFNLEHLTLGAKGYTHLSSKPTSPNATSNGELMYHMPQNVSSEGPTPGIILNTLPMFDIFKKAAKYVADTKNGFLPHAPWKPQSDYATIQGELLEMESTFYPDYRFDRAKMATHSKESIEQNWSYWTCWLLNQFMYHTIHILLNHPFIISLRIAATQRCPKTFSQSTSDQVILHCNWIIRLLELLEEKQITLSDPFLAYCISVAVTVFIHYRSADILDLRQNAVKGLSKGRQALEPVSLLLKNVERMRKLLDRLEAMDATRRSTSPQPATSGPTKQDLLWNLLILSSPNRSAATGQHSLFSKDFSISRNDIGTRETFPSNNTLQRPMSSTTSAPVSIDGFVNSFGTPVRPMASSSSTSGVGAVATASSNMGGGGGGGVYQQGVSQFPATTDPNLMTFNDQNLAAITEFLDQNSGRMFNEWWDFGDL